jgi:hypothetical protein
MSQRSRTEDKYTVVCLYCMHEVIEPNRRPGQKYLNGACQNCQRKRLDVLSNATNLEAVLTSCFYLGYSHACKYKNPKLTADQLANAMCSQWRKGHAPMLRKAYQMGFDHCKWELTDTNKE